ncbi:MAG: rhomboid family intramembrane serine protease [Spirochaetes bacterium]|nr:rhomboid family intramembrane serine protease [Spirochaetota bacterium]
MHNNTEHLSGITIKIIIANIIIFFLQILTGNSGFLIEYFALTPILVASKYHIWQLVTYMFLHGNFAHIFFNMYALLIFGMPIEQEWGSKRFTLYYFFTGIGAGLTIFFINSIFPGPGYYYPTIGASGAVFGLLLAFGFLYPNAELLLFFFIPIKAKYLVILYGLLELFLEISGSSGNISHIGHLGGLFFGLIYFLIFKKHALSFKAKIIRSKILKNLEEHQQMLSERAQNIASPSIDFKVNILKKISTEGIESLNDDEIQFIRLLQIMKDEESQGQCIDVDFDLDDEYCLNCENFDACFLRRVKKYFQS